MAGRTLRCVALAFRTYEAEKVPTGEELSKWVLPEDDLILLAIVGIKVRIDGFVHYVHIGMLLLYLWYCGSRPLRFTASPIIVFHYRQFFFIDQTTTRMSCPVLFLVEFLIEMFEMCTGSM